MTTLKLEVLVEPWSDLSSIAPSTITHILSEIVLSFVLSYLLTLKVGILFSLSLFFFLLISSHPIFNATLHRSITSWLYFPSPFSHYPFVFQFITIYFHSTLPLTPWKININVTNDSMLSNPLSLLCPYLLNSQQQSICNIFSLPFFDFGFGEP